MDLKVYYQKLRTIESEIKDLFPVVISRETTDGGKPGLKTQVSRGVAARLIVDGKVDLASADEAAQFLTQTAAEWRAAKESTEPDAQVKPVQVRRRVGRTRKG
jgi:hypothetical protein